MRILALILAPLLLGIPHSAGADPEPLPPPMQVVQPGQNLYILRINTQERRIFVYRLSDPFRGVLMINSIRDYACDLVLDELDTTRIRKTSTEEIRKIIARQHPDYLKAKEDHEKAFKGQEYTVDDWLKDQKLATLPVKPSEQITLITHQDSVRSGTGTGREPVLHGAMHGDGFFYLMDEANRKLLAYQINGGKLSLFSVRKLEWDERLKIPDSVDLATPLSEKEVKKTVLKQEQQEKADQEGNGGKTGRQGR